MQDARQRQARKLDEKRMNKALRLNPTAEVLVTRVRTGMEMEDLVSQGWRVIASTQHNPVGGTSIFKEFTLAKVNPNSLTNSP